MIINLVGFLDTANTITTKFPPWALHAVGSGMFAVFVLMVLMKMDKEHRERARPQRDDFRLSQPLTAAAAISAPSPQQLGERLVESESDGRVFLTSNGDPAKLMAMCAGMTDVQAKRIVVPYLGKWIRYRGSVRDVHAGHKRATIIFQTGNGTVIRGELTKNVELADILHVGDEIEVIGKLETIDSVRVNMTDVEIVGC